MRYFRNFVIRKTLGEIAEGQEFTFFPTTEPKENWIFAKVRNAKKAPKCYVGQWDEISPISLISADMPVYVEK